MAISQTNFDIDQGTDFLLDVTLLDGNNVPIDISTAKVTGQVRKTASSKEVEACFAVTPIDLVLGKFTISLSALVTSQLKCAPSNSAQRTISQFAYDVEIHYSDGIVNRILSGVLTVSPEVTRI